MPILTYIDDVIYDGPANTFKRLALYSSLYAVLKLGLEYNLVGSPLVFYPNNPTQNTLIDWQCEYRIAFNFLVSFLESIEN